MLTANIRRRALLLAVAGSAISGATTLAQFSWGTPGTGGSWNTNTNWSPVGIPNSPAATATLGAGSPYSVSINSNVTVNAIATAASATLTIPTGVQLTFNSPGAAISNNGAVVLNSSAGASGTYFLLQNADVTLTGTGQVRLNASPANLDTAAVVWWGGGERLTNDVQHAITGAGRIRTSFTNNGTVNADVAGATLWFSDRDKINNGTIKATGGGNAYINCRFDQDAAAVMRAEAGSTVNITGAVYGGSIGSTGNGAVQFVGGSSLGSNTFFGRVDILSGVTTYVENASIVNNGTFTVNPTSANVGTAFALRNGNCTISGTGTLRLNGDLTNSDTAQIGWWGGGEVLTNSSGHSIRGHGRIRTLVTNNSTIAADVSGGTLWLSDLAKTNNSVIEATGGGALYVTSNIVQSSTGIIRCDGVSSTLIQSCNVNGGTITSAPGGSTSFAGSAAVSNNPTFNGSTLVPAGNTMYFEGTGMVNSGTFTVNPSGANTGTVLSMRNGNGTFSGSGSIFLNANAANLDTAQISWWGGGEVVTNAAAHTIRGSGRIRTYLVNEGIVSADMGGNGLWLSDQVKTNNNLIRARNGSTLTITSTMNQNANGRIIVENGSTALFSACTVNGGLLQSTGTGIINTQAGTHFGTLTTSADLRVLPGSTTYLDAGTTLTNNGTIRVGDGVTASAAAFAPLNGNVILAGTGSLILATVGGDTNTAQLTWWGGGEVITNSSTHTIRGYGRIRTFVTNEGTVSSDVPGGTLWLSDQTKTNNNIMKGINGGGYTLSTTLNQGPNGHLQMFDGSVMTISSGSINGGTLESAGSGSYATQASSYLQTLTNNSRVRMLNGSTTYTAANNTITNNGTITVGDTTITSSAAVYAPVNGPVTFDGNGTLLLAADPSNLDLAQISFWGGGEVVTNGTGHTIGGTGRIRTFLTNNGNLTPGPIGGGIGEIRKTDQRLTFAASGRLNIEVASATSFDKISGSAPLTLGGDLQVNLINGYTGGIGTTYEIVRGSSITGTFNVLNIPDHPTAGLKYGVQYTGTSVLLRVTCNVDFNSDGVVDLFDYLDFVDVFSSGVPDSDYNADGVVDLFDYLDYVDQFAAGCN